MPIDTEYDEGFNPPRPECLVTMKIDERWFKATKNALPWRTPADGDATRKVVPLLWLEGTVREAAAPDPPRFQGTPFLPTCLKIDSIAEKLGHMDFSGVLELDSDDDETEEVHVFKDMYELYEKCDAMMVQLRGTPEGTFGPQDLDAYEPHDARHTDLRYMNDLGMDAVLQVEGTFRVYWELSRAIGWRALAADRVGHASLLTNMVGSATGGQLIEVMKAHYGAVGATPAFLGPRIPTFFAETRWPAPWDVEQPSCEFHAFDLRARARWSRAEASEWPSLVQNKVEQAVNRLPVIKQILHERRGAPVLMIRDIVSLGEAVFGSDSARSPLMRIDELERRLADPHGGVADYVAAQKGGGATTDAIVDGVTKIYARPSGEDKNQEAVDGQAGGVVAPKRAQVRKATAEASFAALELQWYGILSEEGQPRKDNFKMFDACFTAASVLPKAVLLQAPGTRLGVYTSESDFLDLLKDEHGYLATYFGQAIAYDLEEGEVPGPPVPRGAGT